MRKLWIGLAVAGGLVVLLLLAVPYFFDMDSQRGILTSRLEAALGRKVKLGGLRLSLLPPALQVNDAEIAEALGFTGPTFTTAKELRARVRLLPLLRGRLEIPTLVLEAPVMRLIKSAKGEWNFASLGKTATPGRPGAGAAAAPAPPLEIGELRIRNGSLTVTDLEKRRPTVTFDRIDLTVTNFSRTTPFEWEVSAHTPGKGDALFSAKGRGGPLNPQNLAESPAEAEVKFEAVDLAMLGAFTEQKGLGGLFSGPAKFSTDGKTARVEGDYRVERLRLSPQAGVAQGPVAGHFKVAFDSVAERLNIEQFQVGVGKAVAHTNGHMLFTGKSATAALHTRLKDAPLADLARVLPVLGVSLPAGSSLTAGTLNAEVRVAGPVALPSRRGNVEVRNARLANYNIAGQVGAVAKLAGVDTGGKDTVIEQFKTSFVTENRYTNTPDITLVIPGMNIAAAGGFADSGALNLQGTATLTRANAVGSILQRVTGSSGGIPFKVGGTLEKPSFMPDMGRMVTGVPGAPVRLGQEGGKNVLKGLGGLFGRK